MNETGLVNAIFDLPGLQAYFPLNETAGNAINMAPATKGSYDATVANCTQGSVGQWGSCYDFSGSGSGITPATLTINTAAFTVGMIVKRTGNQASGSRVLDFQGGGPANGMMFQMANSTDIQYDVKNNNTSQAQISFTLTDGAWTFIVASYAVNSAKLFKNGSQSGVTDTSVTMTASTAIITLGKRSTGASNYFKGSMQHFFYCNQVLDPTTISNLAVMAGLK